MVPANIKEALINSCCTWVEPSVEAEELIDDDIYATWPKFVGERILFWGKKNSYWPFHCFVGADWPIVVLTYMIIVVANAVVLAIIAPLGWPVVLAGSVSCVILLAFYTATVATNPGIIYKEVDKDSESVIQSTSSSAIASESQQPMLELEPGLSTVEENATNPSRAVSMSVLTGESSTTVISPMEEVGVRPPDIPSTIECGQCKIQRPFSARHCYYCKVCVNELDHHCPWCGQCIGEANLKSFHCFIGCLSFQFYFLLCSLLYFIVVHVAGTRLGK